MAKQKNFINQLYKTKTFRENEVQANGQMATGLLVIAVLFVALLFLFTTGAIQSNNPENYALMFALFLLDIFFLVLGFMLSKTTLVNSSNFKYFLLTLMICVMATLNILLPKHGILAWAICIAFASAYHSRLAQIYTVLCTEAMMLLSMYVCLMYGEWDITLFNHTQAYAAVEFLGKDATYILSASERIEFLKWLGNRWHEILLYYYLPRTATVCVLSAISYAVAYNNRTMLTKAEGVAMDTEKTETELSVAANIQLAALPKDYPHNDNFDLYAIMHPAKAVGGDFYDFFPIGENHYAFLVADVSGKGVPAAMFMMKAKTLIKALSQSGVDVDHVITRANEELCIGNEADMFVTCFFAGLNVKTGELHYVNAGHNPILLKHKTGSFEYLREKPQFVMAGLDSYQFKTSTVFLDPGDEIFIYTDGVTEALNDRDQFYGEEAFKNDLNSIGVHNGKVLIEGALKKLRYFVNGAEQADDITMMLLRYFGETRREVVVPATAESTQRILDFVEQYLEQQEASMKIIAQMNVAIDEIYSNIAKFAYPEGDGNVTVVLDMLNETDVCIRFVDNGVEFNPLAREDPDVELSADERGIGGLGIFIVKKTMDDVSYAYQDGLNVLTLVKKIK